MKVYNFQTIGEAYTMLTTLYDNFFSYRDSGAWDNAFFSKKDWEELAEQLLGHKNLSLKGYQLIRSQYRALKRGWK